MLAPYLFSFTWNAPPALTEVRGQRTVVQFYLEEEADKCRLTFVNSGYGQGQEWQASRDYFVKAWGEIVLPRLKFAVETGQSYWRHLEEIEPIPYS